MTEGEKTAGSAPAGVTNVPTSFATWRKEFRIVGQVGEPGEKDKLSFVSLARQVEHGVRKGFSSEEIIEAMVRAISPGLRLRSYLEGRTDLSLPDLRRVLRAHYREKDATAVFQELSTAAQQPKETPHDFVLRVLDLKQKVIFASQEAGAGVTYDPSQVQRMAPRSISTGISNEAVQVEIRPMMQKEQLSDEELLVALTLAVQRDAERTLKLKPKGSRISSIDAKGTIEETPPLQTQPTSNTGLNLKELTASIQAIVKAEIQALQVGGPVYTETPTKGKRMP